METLKSGLSFGGGGGLKLLEESNTTLRSMLLRWRQCPERVKERYDRVVVDPPVILDCEPWRLERHSVASDASAAASSTTTQIFLSFILSFFLSLLFSFAGRTFPSSNPSGRLEHSSTNRSLASLGRFACRHPPPLFFLILILLLLLLILS